MISRYRLSTKTFEVACDITVPLGWHTLGMLVSSETEVHSHYRAYSARRSDSQFCVVMRDDWLVDDALVPADIEDCLLGDVLVGLGCELPAILLCRGTVCALEDTAILFVDTRRWPRENGEFVVFNSQAGYLQCLGPESAPGEYFREVVICQLVDMDIGAAPCIDKVSKARLLAHWMAAEMARGAQAGRRAADLEAVVQRASHFFLARMRFGDDPTWCLDALRTQLGACE
ncbi:MAG: hypothetical protein AB8B57_10240 [Congregibacter sp.]